MHFCETKVRVEFVMMYFFWFIASSIKEIIGDEIKWHTIEEWFTIGTHPKLQVVSSSSMGLSLRSANLAAKTSMGHGSRIIKRCIYEQHGGFQPPWIVHLLGWWYPIPSMMCTYGQIFWILIEDPTCINEEMFLMVA